MFGCKEEKFDYSSIIEDKDIEFWLDHYYKWYTDTAVKYKKWYYFLSICIILLNISIPIVNSFSDLLGTKTARITTIISSIGTLISGLLLLFNYQEKRIRYRKTSEEIKTSLLKYKISLLEGLKDVKTAKIELLRKLESICSSENKEWLTTVDKKEKLVDENNRDSFKKESSEN